MVYGIPIVDISLDYDQSLSLGSIDGRTWTRITEDGTNDYTDLNMPVPNMVLGIRYSYGRDRFIVGDFETGTAVLVLNNDNGEWTPDSGVNTIGGEKLAPGMFVRVGHLVTDDTLDAILPANTNDTGLSSRQLTDTETVTGYVDGRTWTNHGSTNYVNMIVGPVNQWASNFGGGINSICHRFQGRILTIEDRYEEGGRGAVSYITLADALYDLAAYEPGALGSPRAAEQTSARASYLMGEALNTSDLEGALAGGGIYNVEASDLPGNYLEECRVAARAEGGAIFVDHQARGRVYFWYANYLLEAPRSTQVQETLGVGRFPIMDARVTYSLLRVYNRLRYSNSSTTVDVSDATSIAAYSTRTLTKSVLNNDNTDLDTIADRDLAILKDAKLSIQSVVMSPENLFHEVLMARTTIGDRFNVTVVNNGWEYTQSVLVAGITETWDPESGDWTVMLRVDDRSGDTVIS